jgi:hypothetical protein
LVTFGNNKNRIRDMDGLHDGSDYFGIEGGVELQHLLEMMLESVYLDDWFWKVYDMIDWPLLLILENGLASEFVVPFYPSKVEVDVLFGELQHCTFKLPLHLK